MFLEQEKKDFFIFMSCLAMLEKTVEKVIFSFLLIKNAIPHNNSHPKCAN